MDEDPPEADAPAGAEAADAEEDARDERVDWIRDRVCLTLRVREEAFAKLLAGDGR
jgi:hypothetical protein